MYNKTILMGRICNDLELKSTPSGISILLFRLAVERSYCAKGEDRKTDFFNIVAWRSTAEFIAKWFAKGRMILLDGELQTRSYKDKNGAVQYVTELVVNNASFTGETVKKNEGGSTLPPPPPEASPHVVGESSDKEFVEAVGDDDYPF